VAVPLSIDTVKPGVAREALRAGASIINDIAANREDEEMWRLAARTGAAYVTVHMQGSPATMQKNPVYDDVVAEVGHFFEDRLKRLLSCGVNAEQVVLDVGLGFGKRLEDNLRLLARLNCFTKWERPLLVGASRKSFLRVLERSKRGGNHSLPRCGGHAARRGDDRSPDETANKCPTFYSI
jgi:dihydropteroate synthase